MPKYTFELNLDAEVEDSDYKEAGNRIVNMLIDAQNWGIRFTGAIMTTQNKE